MKVVYRTTADCLIKGDTVYLRNTGKTTYSFIGKEGTDPEWYIIQNKRTSEKIKLTKDFPLFRAPRKSDPIPAII